MFKRVRQCTGVDGGASAASNLETPPSSSQAHSELPFDFSQGHCFLRVLFMTDFTMINHGKMEILDSPLFALFLVERIL